MTLEQLRDFLKQNGDYQILIDPCALYGCFSFEVMFLGQDIGSSFGESLSKRIEESISIIENHKNALKN